MQVRPLFEVIPCIDIIPMYIIGFNFIPKIVDSCFNFCIVQNVVKDNDSVLSKEMFGFL